jgi:hypothetical protein
MWTLQVNPFAGFEGAAPSDEAGDAAGAADTAGAVAKGAVAPGEDATGAETAGPGEDVRAGATVVEVTSREHAVKQAAARAVAQIGRVFR